MKHFLIYKDMGYDGISLVGIYSNEEDVLKKLEQVSPDDNPDDIIIAQWDGDREISNESIEEWTSRFS